MAQSEVLAKDLKSRFSLDTQIQTIWVPAIEAQLDLDRNDSTAALKTLQVVSGPGELGVVGFPGD